MVVRRWEWEDIKVPRAPWIPRLRTLCVVLACGLCAAAGQVAVNAFDWSSSYERAREAIMSERSTPEVRRNAYVIIGLNERKTAEAMRRAAILDPHSEHRKNADRAIREDWR